ncbi:MAG: hypothetical protein MI757_17265 [Pirellulales bacterium]|nr:hypothetical protein [Pirellulales bacterium]
MFTFSWIKTPLIIGCLATCALGQEPSSAAAKATTSADVAKLVEQLADESFKVREAAMAALIEVGLAAEPAVRAATESTDPEMRYRAGVVLRQIDRVLLERRREAFRAGDLTQLRENTDTWQRLVRAVGNSRETREMFVQMQIEAQSLLDDAEQKPNDVSQAVMQMYQAYLQARRTGGKGVKPGALAAVVLVATDPAVKLDTNAANQMIALISQARTTMDKQPAAFRKLLGNWLATVPGSSSQVYQCMNLAFYYQLSEGVELAKKVMNDSRYGRHPTFVAQALLTIGRVGDKGQIGQLEKMIGRNTPITRYGKGSRKKSVQVGDLALAMSIVLSGEKLRDYGFKDAPEGKPGTLAYTMYGFNTDADRKAAKEKWQKRK